MVAKNKVERFDVYLISFDPTKGSEIKKIRPCLIISPNEMNRHIRTVITAPMTSTIKNYPSRVTTTFQKKRGQIVLDQIRTVDKQRLVKKLGTISSSAQDKTLDLLQEMFAPWVRKPNTIKKENVKRTGLPTTPPAGGFGGQAVVVLSFSVSIVLCK